MCDATPLAQLVTCQFLLCVKTKTKLGEKSEGGRRDDKYLSIG